MIHDTIAMFQLLLLAVFIPLNVYGLGPWTECSVPCGTGLRSDVSNKTLQIRCHAFDCENNIFDERLRTDILFIVDSSQNIGELNFWKTKQLMVDVVNRLARSILTVTGMKNTRFACVTYDNEASTQFDFDNDLNLANYNELKTTIWDLPYNPSHPGVNLNDALLEGANVFDEHGHPAHGQIAVIISYDGDALSDASDEALKRIHEHSRAVGAHFPASTKYGQLSRRDATFPDLVIISDLIDYIAEKIPNDAAKICKLVGTNEECADCGISKQSVLCDCVGYFPNGTLVGRELMIRTFKCCKKPCEVIHETHCTGECDKCSDYPPANKDTRDPCD